MEFNRATYNVRTVWRGRIRAPDFRAVLGGAVLLAALFSLDVQNGPIGLARIILGLAYVLYVPGYCLLAALFPGADDLDAEARPGASIGLSIALIPILALLLDRLPWGIRPWPMIVSEYGVISVCAGIALWRRAALPAESAYVPHLDWRPQDWWQGLPRTTQRLALTGGGILLCVGSLLGVLWLSAPPSDQTMTEFYILGAGGQAQDYPRAAAAGDVLTVTLGLVNHEQALHQYRIEIWVADSLASDHRMLVTNDGPLTLERGQQVEHPIAWRLPWRSQNEAVEFLLFKDGQPQPYRSLRLWLNDAAASLSENNR